MAPVLLPLLAATSVGRFVLDAAAAESVPEALTSDVVIWVLVPVVDAPLVADVDAMFVLVPSSAKALVLKPVLVLT